MDLLQEIKQEYGLCIQSPETYKQKVEHLSDIFSLKNEDRLMSDKTPVFFTGQYHKSPFIMFGLNPGNLRPDEEKEARISFEAYQNLYLNYFAFSNRKDFYGDKSRYFESIWQIFSESQTIDKWQFFNSCITTFNLIPYHSKGIELPRIFHHEQLEYVKKRFDTNMDFVVKFSPKLFIFNGRPWHTFLIKYKVVDSWDQIIITKTFSVYFFKIREIPCVLFDKLLQAHYWGLTIRHRKQLIPKSW